MNQGKMRSYDKEFKINAVSLYLSSGKSYQQISQDLGIPGSTLAGWVEEHKKAGAEAFVGKGHIKVADKQRSNQCDPRLINTDSIGAVI